MFTVIWLAASLVLLSATAIGVYRLYLSPLARVPGPKLAALTGLYEMYYDLVEEGRFPWKLRDLHKQYGPIVRIAPGEVHIDDPAFLSTHLSSSSAVKRNKYKPHQAQLGVPQSVMSTVDADQHRARRAALAPFFSPRSVAAHEPCIRSKVENVSARLARARSTGEVVELRLLFWCMTTDVITELAFPKGMALLAPQDLNPDYRAFQSKGQRKLLWFKHFPVLWTVLRRIPPSWLVRLAPQAKVLLDWEMANKTLVGDFVQAERSEAGGVEGATVFHHLLRSGLPPAEKRLERLWQEGSSLVGAGVETVANTLVVTLFHLQRNRDALARLDAELRAAMPSTSTVPTMHELAGLPYLTAVVNEGLRKAMGVVSRLVRVAPYDAVAYGPWLLPPGTAVSMSTLLVHTCPRTFPDPDAFAPERWLPGGRADKSKLIAFGKGPRACLGINLAHAELYLTLAVLVRRFSFELFQTAEEDVDPRHDSVLPMPWKGSKGVRVLVR